MVVLALLHEVYWGSAVFFSVIFGWQLLATFMGLGGAADHADAAGADDAAGGHDAHDGNIHSADSVASFKLLSVRSVVAFGVLFGWAGVLYTKYAPENNPNLTMIYSVLWGTVGMLIVSSLFYLLRRMTETGTPQLSTSVGQRGTVYMDIPAGGMGKIRCTVSNAVSFVNARAASGEALTAGTPVLVKRVLDTSTVEVEKAQE